MQYLSPITVKRFAGVAGVGEEEVCEARMQPRDLLTTVPADAAEMGSLRFERRIPAV